MTCYRPVDAWQSVHTGRLKFTPPDRNFQSWESLQVPCGKCIGCRITRAQQWGLRCQHEASMHDDNSFLTLTYREEDLPSNGSLVKSHLTLFWKRLRQHIARDLGQDKRIRYFASGEYGDLNNRPHYHACLFGHDFADKRQYKKSKSGNLIWSSETLNNLWQLGDCTIGALTFESAQYVAQYCVKKLTGPKAKDHYGDREPEYGVMSQGIGRDWYAQHSDNLRNDYIVSDNRKFQVPRYYDKLFEADGGDIQALKDERKRKAEENPDRQNPDRLAAGEYIKEQKFNQFKRTVS